MRIAILLLLTVGPGFSRHVRDLRRKGKEEEPFSVQNDLFSQALSLTAPDGSIEEEELSRELSVTTSEIFTGPTLAGVTPLPPGYSPQPPGFQTEEEAKQFRNQSNSFETENKEDRFRMSSGSDEISVEKNVDTSNKEIRNFHPELISVGELSLKPPGIYDPDTMAGEPAFEGSGATFDVDNTTSVLLNGAIPEETTATFLMNTTISEMRNRNQIEIVKTNKLFESTPAASDMEPVRKVFGDAGEERGCAEGDGEDKTRSEGKSKKTIDVDTFLVAGEGSDPAIAVFEKGNETDLIIRRVHTECPPPQLCAKNCFISKNEMGCQVCECLWQALTCETDSDCPERSQHCDLGKCDCSEGFVQDMSRSGMCKAAHAISGEDLSLESLGVEKEEAVTQQVSKSENPEKAIGKGLIEEIQKKAAAYFGKRHRREVLGEKPRSAERLQWPGEA